jgi:hypothetical protein
MGRTRFAIRCRAASARRGQYWIDGQFWTDFLACARLFEFVTDAELVGIADCPLSLHEWDVVPVEWPAAAFERRGALDGAMDDD